METNSMGFDFMLEASGLNKQEAADYIGITLEECEQWRFDVEKISKEKLTLLANRMNIDVDFLIKPYEKLNWHEEDIIDTYSFIFGVNKNIRKSKIEDMNKENL